jgi:hypothetical protein
MERSETDRGEFIEMGTCVDCKKSWGMYQSEKIFFENLVKTVKDFEMPKRCPDCRKLKRKDSKRGEQARIAIPQLIDKLCKMANRAETGGYAFHDETLAKELMDVAGSLRVFVMQNKSLLPGLEHGHGA